MSLRPYSIVDRSGRGPVSLQPQPEEPVRSGPMTLVGVAELILEMRRWRNAGFPEGLFGEPAWDVLLVLFIADGRKGDLHQADVIAKADVPKTTAGRMFDRLETEGVIKRKPGRDIRKRYVSLTEDGRRRMTRLLTMVAREMAARV